MNKRYPGSTVQHLIREIKETIPPHELGVLKEAQQLILILLFVPSHVSGENVLPNLLPRGAPAGVKATLLFPWHILGKRERCSLRFLPSHSVGSWNG